MLRILGSELFISVMQAVAFMSLVEVLLGQNYVNSTVVYSTLLLSSIGLLSGLLVVALKGKKQLRSGRGN